MLGSEITVVLFIFTNLTMSTLLSKLNCYIVYTLIQILMSVLKVLMAVTIIVRILMEVTVVPALIWNDTHWLLTGKHAWVFTV